MTSYRDNDYSSLGARLDEFEDQLREIASRKPAKTDLGDNAKDVANTRSLAAAVVAGIALTVVGIVYSNLDDHRTQVTVAREATARAKADADKAMFEHMPVSK